MKSRTCPRCKKPIPAGKVGAGLSLSRKDNQTIICDACGTKEAFEDMNFVPEYKGKPYWKVAK